jgi:STE24 endopeptidase
MDHLLICARYFYGLPWSKHIVIYDTLMEKSTAPEVEAVLGWLISPGRRAMNVDLLSRTRARSLVLQ